MAHALKFFVAGVHQEYGGQPEYTLQLEPQYAPIGRRTPIFQGSFTVTGVDLAVGQRVSVTVDLDGAS